MFRVKFIINILYQLQIARNLNLVTSDAEQNEIKCHPRVYEGCRLLAHSQIRSTYQTLAIMKYALHLTIILPDMCCTKIIRCISDLRYTG